MGDHVFFGTYDPETCQYVETLGEDREKEIPECAEELDNSVLAEEVKRILEKKQRAEEQETTGETEPFAAEEEVLRQPDEAPLEEVLEAKPFAAEKEVLGQPDEAPLEEVPEAKPFAAEKEVLGQPDEAPLEEVLEIEPPLKNESKTEDGILLADLLQEIQRLNCMFEEKILAAEKKDTLSKTLYAELQEYKKGVYSSIMKPLIKELVQIHSNILHQGRYLIEKNGDEAVIKVGNLLDYADDIADILEKYDAEVYRTEKGTEFDARIHKVLKKINTSDADLNKKIAYSMADGYYYDNKVLMKENVAVYTYEEESNN